MPSHNPLVLKLDHSGVLEDEDRVRLERLCDAPRRVEAETLLMREGDVPAGVHLVLDGFAYRYKLLPDGRRQIVGLLVPGDFCDLQSVMLRHSDHNLATLTDSVIADIPQAVADELTLEHPRLARALWWSTLVDESILRERLTSFGRRAANAHLAHFFCELLLRLKVVQRSDGRSCEIPFTQDKLADLVGLTPVHVSRTMRELRERGLLSFRNKRLEVADLARLRDFAGFDPGYLHLAAQT